MSLKKKQLSALLIFIIFIINIFYKKTIVANNITPKKTHNINIIKKNNFIYYEIKNNLLKVKLIKKINFLKKNFFISLNKKILMHLNNFENIKKFLLKTKKKYVFLKTNKKVYIFTLIKNKNIEYIKQIIIYNHSYCININFYIKNISPKNINFILKNNVFLKQNNKFILITNNKQINKKINYIKKNFFLLKNPWIALKEKYFIHIWMIKKNKNITYFKINLKKKNNFVNINVQSNLIKLNSGQIKKIKYKYYIGPKIYNTIYHINKTINNYITDYGWFTFILKPIFYLFNFINNYTNSWGYTIIIGSLIIKLLLLPIEKFQKNIFYKIQKIQNKIQQIKNSKISQKKINKKIINLYSKNNIKPIYLFLPIIVQLFIFITIYKLLYTLAELKGKSFLFWIKDLSSYDPYYVLPIIMGITSYISQTSKTNLSIKHTQINIFVSLIFTLFSLKIHSGIILFYIINNILNTIIKKHNG